MESRICAALALYALAGKEDARVAFSLRGRDLALDRSEGTVAPLPNQP